MVRLHEDVDGCSCLRCQEIDHEVLHRSLADAFYWSVTLPFVRPSIAVVFGVVGLFQLSTLLAPPRASVALAILGVFAIFLGRGYIGIVGRGSLGPESPPPASAVRDALTRAPSFVGACLAVLVGLSILVVLVVSILPPGLRWLTEGVGVEPMLADISTLFVLGTLIVYTLLKCCFLPEACFVGGYGSLQSVRVSWQITSVHRTKVLLILTGFVALLAVGVVLDTTLTNAGAPIALSVDVEETTIVLRSFGLSVTSVVRFGFDLAATALYSGLFVHQYVDSTAQVNARRAA